MFTPETICSEIKSLMEGPVTPASIEALAGLLYIKKHCRESLGTGRENHETWERNFTRETAMAWVQSMKNADGTSGPHWTMDKTEEVRAQKGIDCEPLAFYVAMNMMYSDYVKAAEKANASTVDFYACMAKAFLEDKDARHKGMGKLARYYECVVM